MKERPILFSAPMVRALLNGTKTQTRRAIKPEWWRCLDPEDEDDRAAALKQCPYGAPGDRLWVKETWCSAYARGCFGVMSRADGSFRQTGKRAEKGPHFDGGSPQPNPLVKWRPSIFMPRWASRITLELTEVRIQRLWGISEMDAIAEGVEDVSPDPERWSRWRDYFPEREAPKGSFPTARQSFLSLWESINGTKSVAADPWVWALTFKRVAQ